MDPLFWELHSGLAHEAPGSRADTLRALALTGLSGRLRVLDAGSGPGAASLALLEALPEAEVAAVDLHAPFLAAARGAGAGGGARRPARAPTRATWPRCRSRRARFDLVWSEGAAYAVGVPRALAAWAPLLAPGGRIAFSEAVWLTASPAPRARALFAEYPAMTDRDGVRALDRRRGAAAARRLPAVAGGVGGLLPAARGAGRGAGGGARASTIRCVAEHLEEIAVWREHGADYGYGFFVAG